jgi:hypothetical protein
MRAGLSNGYRPAISREATRSRSRPRVDYDGRLARTRVSQFTFLFRSLRHDRACYPRVDFSAIAREERQRERERERGREAFLAFPLSLIRDARN